MQVYTPHTFGGNFGHSRGSGGVIEQGRSLPRTALYSILWVETPPSVPPSYIITYGANLVKHFYLIYLKNRNNRRSRLDDGSSTKKPQNRRKWKLPSNDPPPFIFTTAGSTASCVPCCRDYAYMTARRDRIQSPGGGCGRLRAAILAVSKNSRFARL